MSKVSGLEEFCAAASEVTHAINPIGLPLFAAVNCEPYADDLPARPCST